MRVLPIKLFTRVVCGQPLNGDYQLLVEVAIVDLFADLIAADFVRQLLGDFVTPKVSSN